MIPTDIVNPFDVDPRLELPHPPQDEENWTEYRCFFAYDPDAQVGVSLHVGRIVEDCRVWRGILHVFLPNHQILVRKYAGPDGGERFLGAGPLKVTCVDPCSSGPWNSTA